MEERLDYIRESYCGRIFILRSELNEEEYL
nr:MAG TPA: hypothetical protein [Bacteriophage sp.]